MTNEKGTYILFFSNNSEIEVVVGSLNKITFQKGIYLYIGSAFGPGGLTKRIQRHNNPSKMIFWHIDYLSTNRNFKLISVIEIFSLIKNECSIVNFLLNDIFLEDKISSISNFGSSDCHYKFHLLFLKNKSVQEALKQIKTKMADYKIKITQI